MDDLDVMDRYIARCPICDGVVGITQVENKDHADFVVSWAKQGFVVSRQQNKVTDPMPIWCSRKCDQSE